MRKFLRVLAAVLGASIGSSAYAGSVSDPLAQQIQTLPGFQVELMLKANPKVASWINMARDPQGRLLLGAQRGQPITRVTIANGEVVKEEALKLPVTETMGMLFAFDSLYINGQGKTPKGKDVYGLFRCRSSDGGETFDKVEFLREWAGGSGEHGAHGIVVGPDQRLYIVCGNFVGLPGDLLPSSPHRNYADDRVLPRAEDGNGFGAGKKPPGGFIVRMDPDGKNAELFASGQRNTYDIAFNADGELFGFDSDMEWDWGNPWYRPIRVFHAISAADHGFREGSAKWPEYYPDSLPATVDIGIGCPTGVAFGYGAKFPAKYQKAYYILDWTYGRLIATHLAPQGASYTGSWENFVAPKSLHSNGPKTQLNLTDAVVGDDGALYFTCGGRGTPPALYRVVYTGTESTAKADYHDAQGADSRDLRHRLEAFDGKQDSSAVSAAWPHLASDDRFIRYAARLAIESQPLEQWKSRALSETNPRAALTALLALARYGGHDAGPDLLSALARLPIASLTPDQQLEKLRVIEVCIARCGKPSPEAAKGIAAELDPLYPAASESLNRELCQVLLAVDAPDAVAKTVRLLTQASTQEEQITYIHHLRTIATGWTPELRKQFFEWFTAKPESRQHPRTVVQWFEDAGRPYGNGASFDKFVAGFHRDAEKTLTDAERQELEPVLAAYIPPGGKRPARPVKPRVTVKHWAMSDIEPALGQVTRGRSYERGKVAMEAAQCLQCHKFGNEGGAVGPDLTALASRFNHQNILESILEPSKVVSEQYQNTLIHLKNGDAVEGRILEENAQKLVVQPNPLKPDKVEIKVSQIKSRGPSKVSPMPEGLADILSREELLDLIAYLESGGRKDYPAFGR